MISIIIPVFNAEKYLEDCIKSVLNQTYTDIEIIIIDDGSNDLSWKIIERFQAIDLRIVAVRQENKGVSATRNLGISIAKGEFIVFVDADDFPNNDMCEKLLSHMSSDVDMVVSGIRIIQKKGSYNQCCAEDLQLDKKNLRKYFNYLFELGMINSPFSKLYRKKNMLNGFPVHSVLGEDLIFNLSYINNMQQKLYVCHKALYNYNSTNEDSATKKFREDDFIQIIKLHDYVNSFKVKHQIIIETGDSIDRRLFYDGIQYLNMVYQSNISKKKREYLLDTCLRNRAFTVVCQYKYSNNIKYLFLSKMIIGQHKKMLKIYFTYYRRIKIWSQKLKV